MSNYPEIEKRCEDLEFINKYRYCLPDRHDDRMYKTLCLRLGHTDGVKHTLKAIGLLIPNGFPKKYPNGVTKERVRGILDKAFRLIRSEVAKHEMV